MEGLRSQDSLKFHNFQYIMKVVGLDWIILIASSITLALTIRPEPIRKALMWLAPTAGLVLLFLHRDAAPWARLLASSVGMIYLFKVSILASYSLDQARRNSPMAFLLWPGMDPERLASGGESTDRDAYPLSRGLGWLYAGMALLLASIFVPLSSTVLGWTGLAALLMAIHLGVSEIATSGFRLSGRGVRALFDRPLAARTLNDFWTRRWNLPFVEMNRRLVLPGFLKVLGYRGAILAVFLVSGLLHEMAISYPAGAGWGLPLSYFALQGVLVLAERKLKIRSRLFTWAAILLPLPLLFTAAFRDVLIQPMLSSLHGALVSHSLSWYFDKGLWLMSGAHFLVLVASFQVPGKLNWREELPRLSAFNRKLMYAYGAFIVLTIVTFGVFTIAMHGELLAGSRPAIFFAGFITVFWLLRISLDFFYYKHEDWPTGKQFVVGHALLTSLFAFLVLSYGSLVVWHLV
jgi:hypothetical protein